MDVEEWKAFNRAIEKMNSAVERGENG